MARPSLAAMRVFEAAARLGSFKEAAGELAMTPTAVSHRIRNLEEELGQPLFRRSHRKVELTGPHPENCVWLGPPPRRYPRSPSR